jgi:cyclin-dependent kinase
MNQHGLDMLEGMLVYDAAGRLSAKAACNHPYFEDFDPKALVPLPFETE